MSRPVQIVCEKVRKVSHSFRPLLHNTKGPSFFRRMLLIHTVFAILFYGVTIWFPAMEKKKNVKLITRTLRPLKRMLVGEYVSCSNSMLDILSGIPPTKILVEERMRKAKKIDPDKIAKKKRRDWRAMWSEDTGNVWFKRLFNNLDDWLDRSHGSADFYLTQFFMGHGLFRSYLHKRKLADTDKCILCKTETDTPEHAFFNCNGVSKERSELEGIIGEGFAVERVVPMMLEGKEKWKEIHEFVKLVLLRKRNASSRADAVPTGSSGVSVSH